MFTIGIDIGTTSICVVLFDTVKRESVKTIYISNDSTCKGLPLDYMEQDPHWILEQVRSVTEKIMKMEQVQVVGITSQMHGILYVDNKGMAVSNLHTWKDGRADRAYKDKETYAEYLTRKTGYSIYSGYGIATHYYNQLNNLIPTRAVKICTIGDYVALGLTGRKEPKMDSTMAASLGGFMLEERQFDYEMFGKVSIDCSYLPKVVLSGTVIGYVGKCPIVCACGDNQASFLAAVQNPQDSIGINVGTGSQVSVYYNDYIKIEQIDVRPFFNKGYLYVGSSLNGGKVYEHLAKFIAEICLEFAGAEIAPYSIMAELAAKEISGLSVNPDFYGARGVQSHGGSITGINKENFHGENLVKGFIQGMTKELARLFEQMPEAIRGNRKKIYASGNGLRKNEAFVNEVSKQFGMPVIFSGFSEEAAVGAAICGASTMAEE